jgi:homoserine kinase type II
MREGGIEIMDPAIPWEELTNVLVEYNVGPLIALPEPGGGTANANLTLEAATGKYFLKRRNPKYAQAQFVAFDHRLMEHLHPYAIGTPLAIRTRSGVRWREFGGRIYELFPYQEGVAHDRHSLAQLAGAGRRLAAYHRATRVFTPPAGKEWPRYQDPGYLRETVDAMDGELRSRLSEADCDYLRMQIQRLEREFPDARYHALPKIVVHGDYHPGNVKFQGDAVCGIFDLDWATFQPRLLDLADGVFLFCGERDSDTDAADIVSLTQTWRPSVERTRVFLDAYLETETVCPEEWNALDLAIRARWLTCRMAGRLKLPENNRVDFVTHGLVEPLRALDALERSLW